MIDFEMCPMLGRMLGKPPGWIENPTGWVSCSRVVVLLLARMVSYTAVIPLVGNGSSVQRCYTPTNRDGYVSRIIGLVILGR